MAIPFRIDRRFANSAVAIACIRSRMLCALLMLAQAGCAFSETAPLQVHAPQGGGLPNPVHVGIPPGPQQHEWLWERTVTVLHDYHFNIQREDRFASVIETDYRTGSGILEPWHHDSVGMFNRLESTLQPIRRKVQVSLFPDESGAGYRVGVEAWKEIEYLPGLAANSPGGATFSESTPLERDLNPVVGQTAPSQWIRQGRDVELEQSILQSLMAAYGR
jgi:hypothetical protein